MLILIVEDERGIADFVSRGLESEGYAVRCAFDGEEGERLALAEEVDLVVLDRMLPNRDGLEVLSAIKAAKPALPVIMLTARSEIEDRVAGLDSGATDYLTKPFSFDELAARIRVHLRSPRQPESTQLENGEISLDLLTRRVEMSGREVTLSATEFDLLAYFLRHRGQVLSREQILSGVWGYQHDPGTNNVGVYVSYLRRKLGGEKAADSLIETVRGVGYRLRDEG